MPSVFVTGAGGFLGEHLRSELAGAGWDVIGLSRSVRSSSDRARWVVGDLDDPKAWSEALRGCDLVVHAAAATGNASPSAHRRVNIEGTKTIVHAAVAAGVPRLLLVSSIAAGFARTTAYHYARSKLAAERIVRQSDLATVIVRPTIITGTDAPVIAGLRALATLPIIPLFDGGTASVQPVHARDVARVIVELTGRHPFDGTIVDVGGPEGVSMRTLIDDIHRRVRGGRPRFLRVPTALVIPPLVLVEPILRRWLPVTAGQLATFRNDGMAAPSPYVSPDGMMSLADMLDESLGTG